MSLNLFFYPLSLARSLSLFLSLSLSLCLSLPLYPSLCSRASLRRLSLCLLGVRHQESSPSSPQTFARARYSARKCSWYPTTLPWLTNLMSRSGRRSGHCRSPSDQISKPISFQAKRNIVAVSNDVSLRSGRFHNLALPPCPKRCQVARTTLLGRAHCSDDTNAVSMCFVRHNAPAARGQQARKATLS